MDEQSRRIARPIGMAYNKAQTHLYTWFDDGRVARHEIVMIPLSGGYVRSDMGTFELVEPPPVHNLTDFMPFVPINKESD